MARFRTVYVAVLIALAAVGAGFVLTTAHPTSAQGVVEYSTRIVLPNDDEAKFVRELNDAADKGWEFVQAEPYVLNYLANEQPDRIKTTTRLIFKRPKR